MDSSLRNRGVLVDMQHRKMRKFHKNIFFSESPRKASESLQQYSRAVKTVQNASQESLRGAFLSDLEKYIA